MTRSELREIIGSCKQRVVLAEVFDRIGFHSDSERLTEEVLAVIASLSEDNSGFRKFAIRGYTSRDEYIQNIMSGLGGGIGAGATMGGLPGAAIGGLAGTALGAVRGPAQDMWFKNINGKLSRSMALAQDFARGSQKLAAELNRSGDTAGSTMILQIAQTLHERVRSQFEAMKGQLSQQMGISPESDKKWYSDWGPKIQRYYRMMRSMSDNDMVKTAQSEDYDAEMEAEKEFEKYRQSQPFGGLESLGEMFFGKPLSGGSRSQASVPSLADPQNMTFYPWLATGGTAQGLASRVGLPGLSKGMAAVANPLNKAFAPMFAGEIGGIVGGKVGGSLANQLHGGGKQGEVRRLAGELGQITSEIEKQLGIPMDDIKVSLYQMMNRGFGNQFAGEFGAGYGKQSGDKLAEEYFGNIAKQNA